MHGPLPAAAYVTPITFASVTDSADYFNALRVAMNRHDTNTRNAVTRKIESLLEKENVSVKINLSEMMLDEAIGGGHAFHRRRLLLARA